MQISEQFAGNRALPESRGQVQMSQYFASKLSSFNILEKFCQITSNVNPTESKI